MLSLVSFFLNLNLFKKNYSTELLTIYEEFSLDN